MSKNIEVFFDVGSPASYLAWTQLPALAQRNDVQLIWKPMLLGGVFKATGNQSPVTVPAKGKYTMVDFQRYARLYDVPLKFNPYFPINTLQLMRGVVAVLESPDFSTYTDAVFTAIWVDGKNMGLPEVVAEVLAGAGFDPQEIFALGNQEQVKEKLKNLTEEAVARGVFGAPTFFLEGEMFFGQDRLGMLESTLRDSIKLPQ